MIVLGLGCLLNIGIKQFKEYKAQRKKRGVNYSDVFMQGDLWTEWVNLKLVAWLCLFYLILELPYIIIHQISALKTYNDSTDMRNSTTMIFIQITPKYETVFTWFRYVYSCLFAALVFKTRKDIRHKFRTLLNCCRTNVVRDLSPIPIVRNENRKIKDKGEKKDSNPPLSLNTPVLYISPEGLCLRQLDPNSKVHSKYTKDGRYIEEPKFISYLCDVESTSLSEDLWISPVDSFRSESSKTRLSEESQRRFSEESEISLPEMGSSYIADMQSQEIPKKDIDTSVLENATKSEPSQPKKTVRFADTLTIYRTLTPKISTPTPEWVVNETSGVPRYTARKPSKIPTRIRRVEHTTPWKVELNRTYSVNSPVIDSKAVTRIIDGSKFHSIGVPKSKSGATNGVQIRDRQRPSLAKPPKWKINK
ncbi:uncharacterized protein LOC118183179 [Stegodyphus dumicola]|uniref:uncharacterized protein LOC118183179 n=1 Tax=Stegodyphus dumicola TaxID=202533 RepID=UPI0015B1DCE4|nr:uncharacterized protein LOC118183179 [Stegodyphus dumicola]XP_035208517.1 uncharacterized protein LOC118183179 [Stegodyphus dumicola]